MNIMILKAGWIFLLCFGVAQCSLGDNLDEFKRCVAACSQKTCSNNEGQDVNNNEYLELNFQKTPIPLSLRLLLWDCRSNCDYQCQDVVNYVRKQNNEELYQFHGKWFFVRYFNIQEPASCVFSLFNFISHYLGLRILNQEIIKFKKLNLINNLKYVNNLIVLFENYKIMCKITLCAWTFSTIFHLRDLDITEKLDYFFAGATVLSGLYIATVRLFKLYNNYRALLLLRLAVAFIYMCHVVRLLVDWSYTYNMQINIVWAVIQYGLWAYFSATCYIKYSNYLFKKDFKKKQVVEKLLADSAKLQNNSTNWYITYLKYQPNAENIRCLMPIGLSIWVACGLIFEVFDFPPYKDAIDAHSLWHLTTILPGYIWYHWMVWDGTKLKEQIL